MNLIQIVSWTIVRACRGNPIITTLLVFFIFIMINMLEALLEVLIFGGRFEHWGDVVIWVTQFTYTGYLINLCSTFNRDNP
jgi:hypothetical protein